jgi:hypothetical protein
MPPPATDEALWANTIFNVSGIVALITGGGTGQFSHDTYMLLL